MPLPASQVGWDSQPNFRTTWLRSSDPCSDPALVPQTVLPRHKMRIATSQQVRVHTSRACKPCCPPGATSQKRELITPSRLHAYEPFSAHRQGAGSHSHFRCEFTSSHACPKQPPAITRTQHSLARRRRGKACQPAKATQQPESNRQGPHLPTNCAGKSASSGTVTM